MSQTQGPQTQVRCRVGDRTEDELDRVDDLVNKDLTKVELLLLVLTVVLLTLDAVAGVPGTLTIALEQERLGQQHERHANDGNEEQGQLHSRLDTHTMNAPR